MRGVTALLMLIRLAWVVEIVLGLAFWVHHAQRFIPLHMLVGVVFVLLLWALCAVAAGARAGVGIITLTVVWGAILLILGLTQTRLLVGGGHWVIQVLHLLVGIGGLALAEYLAAKVRRARA